MKFNDVFDTDEVLAWYDGDPQDGTYYRSQEPSRKPFENDFYGVDDRDDRHEEIKKHAALYICAHKELLKKSDYRIAYNKLLDEYARDYAYHVLEKPITVVTDEERAFSDSTLDFELCLTEPSEVQTYKKDAIYIVDWVKSGKNLIVYT